MPGVVRPLMMDITADPVWTDGGIDNCDRGLVLKLPQQPRVSDTQFCVGIFFYVFVISLGKSVVSAVVAVF